ncbi:MAG: hypothetical protein WB729_20660 [Candidatus Sulfotelmatobacter sp.]
MPVVVKTAAAIIPERPIPWRQWMATFVPRFNISFTAATTLDASDRELGTPRSSMGRDTNRMP